MLKNSLFYVAWAVLSVFPLAIAIFASKTIKKKIVACLCILVICFGIVALMYIDSNNAEIRWNNGFCECGGTYELTAATHHLSSNTFYYTCDNCGHTEEFSHIMK